MLLGNLGLAGLVIYAAFLYCTVARRRGVATTRGDEVVGFAARQAMFANLIGATISAAVFDLGPCFYLFSAVPSPRSTGARRPCAATCRGRRARRAVCNGAIAVGEPHDVRGVPRRAAGLVALPPGYRPRAGGRP